MNDCRAKGGQRGGSGGEEGGLGGLGREGRVRRRGLVRAKGWLGREEWAKGLQRGAYVSIGRAQALPTCHLPPPASHLPPPTSHLPPPTSCQLHTAYLTLHTSQGRHRDAPTTTRRPSRGASRRFRSSRYQCVCTTWHGSRPGSLAILGSLVT